MMQSLAEDFGCGNSRSLGNYKSCQLHSQVKELTARLATSLNQICPDAHAQGEKTNVWIGRLLENGDRTDFRADSPCARNEPWDSEAPEVNLQRTIESILSAVFQRIDSREHLEMKYPMTVWSDRDRRDVLQTLEEARCNPCEKLKEIDEWDRLRMRSNESAMIFADAWRISPGKYIRVVNGNSIASKLYSCLQHWKDSYHMLAALEAPRWASIRCCRKCFNCGGSGHYSNSCPDKSIPKGYPSGGKGQGSGRNTKDKRAPGNRYPLS
ncbi:zinc knuckle [Cooperia oncophora]